MVWPFTQASSTSAAAKPAEPSACPVDHTTRERWVAEAQCPVKHEAQDTFLKMAHERQAESTSALSKDREVSSIPRYYLDGSNDATPSEHAPAETASAQRDSHWVYPSAEQFYTAVRRKNHAARAEDMGVVVPIHNAVNEEAWRRILEWEHEWQTDKEAPGPQLVNFVGRPRDVTWRAWLRGLAGYQMPFDRHDWTIVRPSTDGETPHTVRYIIDFYAGKAAPSAEVMTQATSKPVSFFLDVRPAPSTIEGVAMRMYHTWKAWTG